MNQAQFSFSEFIFNRLQRPYVECGFCPWVTRLLVKREKNFTE